MKTTESTHFLTSLTPEIDSAIRSAAYIALDLETTAMTAYSPTEAPTGGKKIGDGRMMKAVLGRAITLAEASPRIRVVSIGLPDGRGMAFDLDKMPPADADRLLSATAACPVWVGQNLGFDLSWYHSAGYPAKPFLLDAMLVVRTCKPSYTHAISTVAGQVQAISAGHAALQPGCYERVDSGSKLGYSLADLVLAYSARKGVKIPVDKSWQKPENWMLPDLIVPAELDYCLGDITLPGEIILDALGVDSIPEAVEQLKSNRVYCAYSSATGVLAEKHASGMYVNPDKVAALVDKELARIHAGVPLVTAVPEFVDFTSALMDTGSTEKADFKRAMADYCLRALSVELDTGKDGEPSVGEPDLILKSVAHNKIIDEILNIREAKKRIGMLLDWRNYAKKDGCIHSLVNSVTDTGRTASSSPNDQQIPHEPEYREVFTARPGYKIIATDYSAVEMRIAARLALRALDELVASNKDSGTPDFFRDKNGGTGTWLHKILPAILKKMTSFLSFETKPDFQKRTNKDFDGAIFHDMCWALSRIKMSGVRSRLAEGFASGIDAHLLTAVGLSDAATEGVDPLKWLQDMSQSDRDALKKRMKNQRQSAKACIAEGQVVLTDKGMVPIEHVTPSHRLWDGVEWVDHGGVIYKGIKEVITYAGLTATPDHKCFTTDEESLYFGEIARRKGHILETEVSGHPVQIGSERGSPAGNTRSEATPEKKYARVYDIINAGPRHRFTVQGLLVANCNFGLLYGMSINGLHRYGIIGYGLDWSLEEAAAQRERWFELYPEILFWQCWSKLTYRKWPNSEWISKNYGNMGTASKRPVFTSKTLSGRPIFTTDARKLLNYQDQGTGADIAMEALENLGELSKYLRAFVHDEFVLEVPEADAEKHAAQLEKVMLDAARSILDPVGIEVETAMGDWWVH